jgi:hypothetical protein
MKNAYIYVESFLSFLNEEELKKLLKKLNVCKRKIKDSYYIHCSSTQVLLARIDFKKYHCVIYYTEFFNLDCKEFFKPTNERIILSYVDYHTHEERTKNAIQEIRRSTLNYIIWCSSPKKDSIEYTHSIYLVENDCCYAFLKPFYYEIY